MLVTCVVSNYEELSMKINQHETLGSLVLPGLSIAKNITFFERKIHEKKVVARFWVFIKDT